MTENELKDGILEYTTVMHMKMKLFINQLLADSTVSPMQMNILHLLIERGGGMRISQLSRILEVTDSNVSAICQRMEKEGLVCRQRDEQDQRVVMVIPTQKGLDIMNTMQEQMFAASRKQLDQFSHEELSTIYRAFKLMADYNKSPTL